MQRKLSICSCLVNRMQKKNHNIKLGNRPSESLANCKYLETILRDENCVYEEIKRRSNSWSACYHSVQHLVSLHLISKNINIKIELFVLLFSMVAKFGLLH